MRFGHKILGGYVVILAATALVGVVSYRSTRIIASDFHRVNRTELPLLEALKDLRLSGIRLVSTTMETAFLADGQGLASGKHQQEVEQEELEEGRQAFRTDLAICRIKIQRHAESAAFYSSIEVAGRQLLEASERFLDLARRRVRNAELLEAKAFFEVQERAFLSLLQDIHDLERWQLDRLETDAFRSLNRTIVSNAGFVGFAILLSLAMGLTISSSISRRVGALEVAAREVASGDLTRRLEVSSQDELSALAGSFNGMVDSLKSSRERLASTNAYLGSLIAAMMDGLLVVTITGEIQDANPSCCRNLGYERQELAGRNFRAFFPSQSEGELVLRDMRSQWGLVDREITLVGKGGMEIHFVLSSSLLPKSGNEPDTFVCLLHNISLRKQAEQRVLNLAYYDQLTGLPNRALFMDRLNQAIAFAGRNGDPLVIFFFDLDRFKDVNETLGHGTGDQLLQQVALRLGNIVRKSDTLARLGGDEFVLLCRTFRDMEDASLVATRMLDLLGAPFVVDGNEVHSGASIGIVLHPVDGADATTLLRNADLAMYAAKEAGRHQYTFFSGEMNRKAQERAVIEVGLRQGVLGSHLGLHYQPLIDLSTGHLMGVEALCRWTHPELGPISPARFIPVAEQIGVIRFLGEWVLGTACQQGRAWKEAGLDFRVWVNVSAAQLLKPDFPEQVAGSLLDAGLEPAWLGLELTESMLMGTERESMVSIKRLKELGVALAIDDFGTGYSSLSYLRNFEVDKLKIDRSFVTDLPLRPDAAAIVKAIIAMGHSLGLSITAEGIETEEEAQVLREYGCDEGQGYLFAKPMDLSSFERFLQQRA